MLVRGPAEVGADEASFTGGRKTTSEIVSWLFFFDFFFFFGRGASGLGSAALEGVGTGGRIATTEARHELFGASTHAKR